ETECAQDSGQRQQRSEQGENHPHDQRYDVVMLVLRMRDPIVVVTADDAATLWRGYSLHLVVVLVLVGIESGPAVAVAVLHLQLVHLVPEMGFAGLLKIIANRIDRFDEVDG